MDQCNESGRRLRWDGAEGVNGEGARAAAGSSGPGGKVRPTSPAEEKAFNRKVRKANPKNARVPKCRSSQSRSSLRERWRNLLTVLDGEEQNPRELFAR